MKILLASHCLIHSILVRMLWYFSKKMEKHTKMIDANKLRLLFNDDNIIKVRIFCNNYGMNS